MPTKKLLFVTRPPKLISEMTDLEIERLANGLYEKIANEKAKPPTKRPE